MTKLPVIAALMGLAMADQPVNCLREKIYGIWDFSISKDLQSVNLFQSREVCTHAQPNKVQLITKDFKF